MASKFESLPVELLHNVLSTLSIIEISKLQQCSKPLNHTLDSYLFSLPDAVNKVMQWGCVHGEKWAIEKALSHGADISVVDIARTNTNTPDSAYIQTSTLCLAARRYNYKAFQFLLDSGARLDASGIDDSQSFGLRQRLFDPRKPRLLKQCVDHGVIDQITSFQTGIDEAHYLSVNFGCDLDTCQTWLDLGVDPANVVGKTEENRTSTSALALAILSRLVPLVQMLLSRIRSSRVRTRRILYAANGTEYRPTSPWEAVPILAAARFMGIQGETDMLDILLEAGGDINFIAESHLLSLWDIYDFQWPCALTPLLTYVLTVNFNDDVEDMKLPPPRGVSILFERGASGEAYHAFSIVRYSPC